MKKRGVFCLLMALILMICGPVSVAATAGMDQSVISGCHSVDAMYPLSDSGKILETSKAVILYERNSDTMVYCLNPDQQIYPSSMVKLMTALLAIENGGLTDKVAVTKRALSYVAIGSVSAGLVVGEELTLEDLLYCMMAASANDASTVIAEHIGGTQDTFIKMMNERAAELGMTGTHYSNVHGLHDEQTYTTARDICRLLDYALEDPTFKTMFCAPTYTVPATNKSEERIVDTTNYMTSKAVVKKYYDERVTGGKTGATDEAGRCLAITAEGGGMELLAIVMGATPTYEADGKALKTFGSFEEAKVLLDYAFENYEYRPIFYEGQAVTQFPVENGTNYAVVQPSAEAAAVLPVGLEDNELTWIYGDTPGVISAPVEVGQRLSTIQVWYGAKCIAQADLMAVNAVPVWEAPQSAMITEDPDDAGSWQVLLIVLAIIAGIVVLAMLGMLIVRGIRKASLNAKRKSRRENRRRKR